MAAAIPALAAAAPYISAAGTAVSVVGGIAQAGSQGQAASAEAGYQVQQGEAFAAQSEEEALFLEREAEIEEQNRDYETEMHDLKVSRFLASQRAKFAASGIEMEGSVITVLADTAAWAESEKALIEREYDTRASSRREEAKLTRRRGETAKITGQYLGAATIARGRAEQVGTITRTGSSLLTGLSGA